MCPSTRTTTSTTSAGTSIAEKGASRRSRSRRPARSTSRSPSGPDARLRERRAGLRRSRRSGRRSRAGSAATWNFRAGPRRGDASAYPAAQPGAFCCTSATATRSRGTAQSGTGTPWRPRSEVECSLRGRPVRQKSLSAPRRVENAESLMAMVPAALSVERKPSARRPPRSPAGSSTGLPAHGAGSGDVSSDATIQSTRSRKSPTETSGPSPRIRKRFCSGRAEEMTSVQ